MLANDPISFRVILRSLTAQSTTEAELVTVSITIKNASCCSNIMVKRDFEKGLSSVPFHLDNTSTLHFAGNRAISSWAKHITLNQIYLFVLELVDKGKITIHYVNTEGPFINLGPTHRNRYRHRALIKLVNDF